MTATGHAILGVTLAAAISHPAIGIPTAIISHIAADAFPHWDTGTNVKRNNPKSKKTKSEFVVQSFFDLGISMIIPYLLVQFLFPHLNLFYTYSMVIAAQLLDWMAAPYVFLEWHFPPFSWISSLQGLFDHRLDKPWGIIGQVAILSILIYIAKLW